MIIREILDKISYLSFFIAFFGSIIGLISFKDLQKNYKIITVFLALSFLNDFCSRYILPQIYNSNLFGFSLYSLIDLIMIYLYLINFKIKHNNIFKIFFVIMFCFNIYEMLTVKYLDFARFQTYSRAINSFYLLIMSGVLILQKIKEEKLHQINKIHFILPLYLGITTLVGLPVNLLTNYSELPVFFAWSINNLNATLFYSILTYQLWKYGKIQGT